MDLYNLKVKSLEHLNLEQQMQMNGDPRAQYLAQTAAAILGSPQLAEGIVASPEVATFLNELNVTVL